MTEAEIRRSLVADRHAGFVALVRWSSGDLYRGLVRLTGDRGTAEDLSQETYLRAWSALTGYSDRRVAELKLKGWLWTIAMNRGRSHLSRRKPPDAEPGRDRSVEQSVGDADECERLLRLLAPSVRTAVVLRHVVGLSYAEIGELLDKPVGTVKSDVHRALRILRQNGEET